MTSKTPEQLDKIYIRQHDLKAAQEGIADAHARLDRQVHEARCDGWSWTKIADTLGVTRQACWQRFSPRATGHPAARHMGCDTLHDHWNEPEPDPDEGEAE